MRRALLARLGHGAIVIALVVSACLTLIRLAPGDPFFRDLDAARLTTAQREAQHAAFGYDRPTPEQFVRYVGQVARGELGWPHSRSQPVADALAQAILRLLPPRRGRVVFDGTDLATIDGEPLRRLRRRLQHVAQDAGVSLPAHQSASVAVAEGLEVRGIARGAAARTQAAALLAEVGFPATRVGARLDTLSSGERQRVAIARALGPGPDLLLCDEPTASLDLERREQVLALLERLRDTRGLALLLILYDPAAIARLAPRVLPL